MNQTVFSQIDDILVPLPPEEQWLVLEYVVQRLRQTIPPASPKATTNLYGIWRHAIPADVDVEALLTDIRQEWHKDELL